MGMFDEVEFNTKQICFVCKEEVDGFQTKCFVNLLKVYKEGDKIRPNELHSTCEINEQGTGSFEAHTQCSQCNAWNANIYKIKKWIITAEIDEFED